MSGKLAKSRRLVVKMGSALLADAGGNIRRAWVEALADDIAVLRERGCTVLLVSSGAIAVGRRRLRLESGPGSRSLRLEESQAAAAVGQIRLAHAWQEALARHHIVVAQILLTLDETENRRRYLNARNTMQTLGQMGVVPVINENDTVATDEIRFGDNDRLAARVAQMMAADTCVLLSDIAGLYTADPRTHGNAKLVPTVRAITPEIAAMAGRPRSDVGSGGMITKLEAARIAMGAGCRLAITNGRGVNPLQALDDGAPATWFIPREGPRQARKQWIAGALNPVGVVTVDAGAARALKAGKSLLPAGVARIDGSFERGDPVVVKGPTGTVVSRGLIAYSAGDARRIIGHKSSEIEALLGYSGREEMIHRDDMVLA